MTDGVTFTVRVLAVLQNATRAIHAIVDSLAATGRALLSVESAPSATDNQCHLLVLPTHAYNTDGVT